MYCSIQGTYTSSLRRSQGSKGPPADSAIGILQLDDTRLKMLGFWREWSRSITNTLIYLRHLLSSTGTGFQIELILDYMSSY